MVIGTILWRISNRSDDPIFTPATGSRVHWEELPLELRHALEDRLGAPVVAASTEPGGFSPGLATRLRLADGNRVFVKAVAASVNPESPAMHRREAKIAASLPASVSAPRFLWSYDDGEWVALAFEDLDGRQPQLPWRHDELQRVLDAIGELAAGLTPSPIDAIRVGERLHRQFQGWRRLQAAVQGGDARGDLPLWVMRNLEHLALLESRWEEAAAGETLIHCDLRADNIVLTVDRAMFVDWPHASVGAAWVDLVAMLPSVAMQGGPRPWEIFDTHPLGRQGTDADVTAVVAAFTGYLLYGSRLPAPPGLPTLRAFQRDQAMPALEWLIRRTGWR